MYEDCMSSLDCLSLELRTHLLCSLLTLALLFPTPTQEISYQYLNRKAKRSGNVAIIEIFCKCIYFVPACLFSTALNTKHDHIIALSPNLGAGAPCRAARLCWQGEMLSRAVPTGVTHCGTASPLLPAASGTAAEAASCTQTS